ncbi:MAG: site-specific recombinase [bacterium]|nr:site-specific recombinase [bacterium]
MEVEAQIRVAIRDAVNRKSRKPFYWGGLKGYEQLEAIAEALEEVPSDRPETDYLRRLKIRVDQVVEAYQVNVADLREAHTWLRRIADCLRYPPSDPTPEPSLTGAQVKQEMEALLQSFQPDLKRRPAQAAIHDAWHRTWEEYGADLLPCYDIPGLPPDNLMLESLFGRLRRHQRRVSGRKSTRELRDFGQYQVLFLAESEQDLLEQIRQVSLEEYRENRLRLEEAEAPRRLLHRLHRDPLRTMRNLVDQHSARRTALVSTVDQLSLKRPECPPLIWGEEWSGGDGELQLPIQAFRWECSTACYEGAYY